MTRSKQTAALAAGKYAGRIFDAVAGIRLPAPSIILVVLCVTQVTLWTLAPALVHRAMPIDVADNYMMGREWLLLSYKHPQLPAWVLEISRLLTHTVGWPAYLLSQLFICATFILVFLLGKDLLGPRRAICGTLVLTGVYYYSVPTPEFNHNIAQMPIWVGVILLTRKAVVSGRAGWWLALGVCAALGLYAKFSMLIVIGTAGLWLIIDKTGRRSLLAPAPWIGLLVFLLLATPIMMALPAHDYAPLHYAAEKSAFRSSGAIGFMLSQLADLSGLAAILAFALWRGPTGVQVADDGMPERHTLHFLLFFTLVPLAALLVTATVSGARPMWGSPLWSLSGLIAMALIPRIDATAFRRIIVLAGICLVSIPAGYAAFVAWWPIHGEKPLRVMWPQAEIAARFADIWRERTHAPLRIVGGEEWTAELIGSVNPDTPSLYISRNPAFSPWVSPARIRREGMLIVWSKGMPDLHAFGTGLATGSETFPWPHDARRPPIKIDYAIVVPAGGDAKTD